MTKNFTYLETRNRGNEKFQILVYITQYFRSHNLHGDYDNDSQRIQMGSCLDTVDWFSIVSEANHNNNSIAIITDKICSVFEYL